MSAITCPVDVSSSTYPELYASFENICGDISESPEGLEDAERSAKVEQQSAE